MSCASLMAIHVERRSIAVAVFSGIRLDYVHVRELSFDHDLARLSAKSFVSWALEAFRPDHLLLELPSPRDGRMRADLREIVKLRLAAHPVGRTYMPPESERRFFGVPEPRSARELEVIAKAIWPNVARSGGAGLRAATFGLAHQMSVLISDH